MHGTGPLKPTSSAFVSVVVATAAIPVLPIQLLTATKAIRTSATATSGSRSTIYINLLSTETEENTSNDVSEPQLPGSSSR